MDLVALYGCFCDRTRLRILNLLGQGPLCVCHIQDILDEPQVKVSKHLGYLKTHGLVTVRKVGNWRVYGLIAKPHRALAANLACLQDCAAEDKTFRRDLVKLLALRAASENGAPGCCAPPQSRSIRFKAASA